MKGWLQRERPQDGREWMSTKEAAERLGLSVYHFLEQAKRQGLTRYGAPAFVRPYWFLREEIESWAEFRRMRAAWLRRHRRASSQTRWTEKIEPELAQRLFITSDEASYLLGVKPQTVCAMVHRGRLVCYQEEPGHSGKRLWFSRREVERVRDDPERTRRRAAYQQAQKTAEARWGKGGHRTPQAVEPTGKQYDASLPPGWIPAREAARRLGVNPIRVNELRRSGRLLGKQRWRRNRQILGWYYSEVEVAELLQNEGYRKMRGRYEAECAKKAGPPEEPGDWVGSVISVDAPQAWDGLLIDGYKPEPDWAK